MTALNITGLACRYNGQPVLQDLSLSLADNEILCLLGASGCGKTTLLKAIAGLVPVAAGEIRLHDQLVEGQGQSLPPEARQLGFIFQDYALFPHLSVAENLAFGLRHHEREPGRRAERVEEGLALVGLEELGGRYPHELSGGQQQRVAIARALVCRPRLLLLDEPFSNIDSQVRGRLIHDIRRLLKAQGIAAIFVTHSKDEAFAFADRLAVFHEGHIAQVGRGDELYHQPATRYVAEFMGAGTYLPARVRDGHRIDSPLGMLTSTRSLAHSAGQPVELFVRPQQLALGEDVAGEPVQLLEQQFLGSHVRCLVAWRQWRLEVWRNDLLPVDQPLRLSLRAHEPVLFAPA